MCLQEFFLDPSAPTVHPPDPESARPHRAAHRKGIPGSFRIDKMESHSCIEVFDTPKLVKLINFHTPNFSFFYVNKNISKIPKFHLLIDMFNDTFQRLQRRHILIIFVINICQILSVISGCFQHGGIFRHNPFAQRNAIGRI